MRWQKIINIALKALIFLLIIHALVYPDLIQYQNKGMQYRLIGYPLAAFSVLIIRFFSKRKRVYPYDIDILLTLIIALDMLGNALGFYGSIEWWDDAMHLINCALLTIVFIKLMRTRIENPVMQQIAVIGVVSWLQVAWEIAEYATFVTTNTCEFPTAYRDTIGDLLLGQIGVILTVQAVYFINKRRHSKK